MRISYVNWLGEKTKITLTPYQDAITGLEFATYIAARVHDPSMSALLELQYFGQAFDNPEDREAVMSEPLSIVERIIDVWKTNSHKYVKRYDPDSDPFEQMVREAWDTFNQNDREGQSDKEE